MFIPPIPLGLCLHIGTCAPPRFPNLSRTCHHRMSLLQCCSDGQALGLNATISAAKNSMCRSASSTSIQLPLATMESLNIRSCHLILVITKIVVASIEKTSRDGIFNVPTEKEKNSLDTCIVLQ